MIKDDKGKETDTAEERREDTWQPAAKQGTETTTPQKPQTEHRSQERKPDGQSTGKTAGASYRRGGAIRSLEIYTNRGMSDISKVTTNGRVRTLIL